MESQQELDTLKKALTLGAGIIRYDYAISIIILTFKRQSKPIIVFPWENRILKGIKYNAVTFLFGWWGFPMGPVYTLASLLHNFRGGSDCTSKVAEKIGWGLTQDTLEDRKIACEKKIKQAVRWARYSIILGICSILLNYLTAIPGIILGHRARKILKRYGAVKGLTSASVGLIINYLISAAITTALICYYHLKP